MSLCIIGWWCVTPSSDIETTDQASTATWSESYTTTAIASTADFLVYRGEWFDIQYPADFRVSSGGEQSIWADEAYFSSPDGTVEFFVYSPMWSWKPQTYLTIQPHEVLVSEKISYTSGDANSIYQERYHWSTIQARDKTYYRSFLSIAEWDSTSIDQIYTTHHVFGIKYTDDASYSRYKKTYDHFTWSLIQYLD